MPVFLNWTFLALFLMVLGVMCVGGAALNLAAFMNHPAAERFVEKYGRNGARVFYVMLGLLLGASGVVMLVVR